MSFVIHNHNNNLNQITSLIMSYYEEETKESASYEKTAAVLKVKEWVFLYFKIRHDRNPCKLVSKPNPEPKQETIVHPTSSSSSLPDWSQLTYTVSKKQSGEIVHFSPLNNCNKKRLFLLATSFGADGTVEELLKESTLHKLCLAALKQFRSNINSASAEIQKTPHKTDCGYRYESSKFIGSIERFIIQSVVELQTSLVAELSEETQATLKKQQIHNLFDISQISNEDISYSPITCQTTCTLSFDQEKSQERARKAISKHLVSPSDQTNHTIIGSETAKKVFAYIEMEKEKQINKIKNPTDTSLHSSSSH